MSDRAIIEAVNKMSGLYKVDQVSYTDAVVESVDTAARTCTCSVLAGNAEYQVTAKLMAAVDDGLFIEPAIGSTVKLIFSVNVEPFVCQYSEIANITIDAASDIKIFATGNVTINCDLANIISDKIRLGGNKSIVLTDLPAGSKIPDVGLLFAGNITGN